MSTFGNRGTNPTRNENDSIEAGIREFGWSPLAPVSDQTKREMRVAALYARIRLATAYIRATELDIEGHIAARDAFGCGPTPYVMRAFEGRISSAKQMIAEAEVELAELGVEVKAA
jgi:hypothetical protein